MSRKRKLFLSAAILAISLTASRQAVAQTQLCSGSTDDHIFYVDTTEHVAEVCQSQAAGTFYLSLSGTGATAIDGRFGLASFYASGEHVGYIGTNYHVYQLYTSGGTWVNQDLTAATGAPDSGPAGSLTGYVAGNVESFVFLDASGHARQIYYNGSWHASDLTALTGAPVAASSALTSYVASIQSVLYLSSDGHVHQLYYNGSWHASDLTALTGAPSAALEYVISQYIHIPTPLASFDDTVGVQNVYYVTESLGQYDLNRLFFTSTCNCWQYGGTVNVAATLLKGSRLAGYGQGSSGTARDDIFWQGGNGIYNGSSTVLFAGGTIPGGAGMAGWPETSEGVTAPTLAYIMNPSSGIQLVWQYGTFSLVQLTGTGGVVPQSPTPLESTPLASFVGP